MTENLNTSPTTTSEWPTVAAMGAPLDAPSDSLADGDWNAVERSPFVPDYTPSEATRIHRRRLHTNDGGVAEVTFDGDLDATECWIRSGSRGVPSLYAQVDTAATVETTVRVAIVPTGKRVPLAHDGSKALRLGQAGRVHAYLLSVESAPQGTRAAAQAAEAAAEMLAATAADSDTPTYGHGAGVDPDA